MLLLSLNAIDIEITFTCTQKFKSCIPFSDKALNQWEFCMRKERVRTQCKQVENNLYLPVSATCAWGSLHIESTWEENMTE